MSSRLISPLTFQLFLVMLFPHAACRQLLGRVTMKQVRFHLNNVVLQGQLWCDTF